jgi:hypothetical protein
MDAKEFNRQYEDLLVAPLRNIGFRTNGGSLSYTKDHTVLALLRFQMKFSGLTQRTHFLLCVRHVFLRTLEKEPTTKFLSGASEYPFKLPVSKLSEGMLESWHYQPTSYSAQHSRMAQYVCPFDDEARKENRQGGDGAETGYRSLLDVAQGMGLRAVKKVRFARGPARTSRWCEVEHRAIDWAARSSLGRSSK